MNPVSIGRTLRHLRKQSNLSMQELGDKVALSQASISRLESGVTDINFAQLSNVCDVFELSLTDFFAMVEQQMDLKLDVSPIEVKTIDEKLVDIIQQLSDEQKKGLYVLLQPYVK
ncbi:helix-turn-helix transcriptional regulator [Viridibacillus sp. YIM B01967]|uniref:Helix-turn-helix transcriptional regulator n=1 Tax=Viridibacillus soli TaxID=2798301 RepID=A0ABS1HCN4_9BACL|nr:helix-turn-helix transcriptional regulator [Viridibacillus soli]MBK3497177.1 helix-turn-helix transcriptional regulator [Viridibacillus soli]